MALAVIRIAFLRVERTTVKVMWDYHAYPLWITAGPGVPAGCDSVPVSESLLNDLQVWSDELTELMWGACGPDRSKGPTDEQVERMDERGLELAHRVRAELDDHWTVTFFAEADDSETEIVGPPRPIHRRHDRR